MITSKQIREALATLIKDKAGLDMPIFFNQVLDTSKSYAFVSLNVKKTDEGYDYFVRRLTVTIQIVLAPMTGVVKHSDLLDICDALDAATHGYVTVADRAVTVYETSANIFDDILTYSMELCFCDEIASTPEELAQYDLADNIELNINDR